MEKLMNLQLFSGGHSVSVVADGGFSAASASSTSDVQADATVTLTLTPADTYELASVEVLSGGVTLEVSALGVYSFKMGSANVTIVAKSKKNNLYKIVENCDVWVNGTKTSLQRNLTLKKGPNGAIIGVDGNGTAVTLSAEIVAELVKAGTLVKV